MGSSWRRKSLPVSTREMPPSIRFTSKFMEPVFSIRDPARYVRDNYLTFSCPPVVQVKTISHSTNQLMVCAIMKEHENFVLYQKKQKSESRIEVIEGRVGGVGLMVLGICNLDLA